MVADYFYFSFSDVLKDCRSSVAFFLFFFSPLEDKLLVAMSSLSRELVFLILQFLDEEKFKETVHK